MWDLVEVTIDGTYAGTYYVSADLVKYISSDFVNIGSETIYLYNSLSNHTEYIRLNPLSDPIYYRSYQQQITINDITEITYNTAGYYYRNIDIIYLFVLFVVCISSMMRVIRND